MIARAAAGRRGSGGRALLRRPAAACPRPRARSADPGALALPSAASAPATCRSSPSSPTARGWRSRTRASTSSSATSPRCCSRACSPARRRSDPRFEVATRYVSAIETLEVGGDWYDTFATGEHRIGIVVGDVVGRGIVAASAMGQLRSAVRALAAAELGPAAVIDRLDAFVAQIETARWATLAYADVDLDTRPGALRVGRAPAARARRAGRESRLLWIGRSPPLGVGGRPGGRSDAESRCRRAPGCCSTRMGSSSAARSRSTTAWTGSWRNSTRAARRRCRRCSTSSSTRCRSARRHRDDVCLLCLAFRVAPDPG